MPPRTGAAVEPLISSRNEAEGAMTGIEHRNDKEDLISAALNKTEQRTAGYNSAEFGKEEQ